MKKSLLIVMAFCFLTSLSVVAGKQCKKDAELDVVHKLHKEHATVDKPACKKCFKRPHAVHQEVHKKIAAAHTEKAHHALADASKAQAKDKHTDAATHQQIADAHKKIAKAHVDASNAHADLHAAKSKIDKKLVSPEAL
jgi:acyl-CoA reductase-like NAD-dependent aldehyde dehydrogenase